MFDFIISGIMCLAETYIYKLVVGFVFAMPQSCVGWLNITYVRLRFNLSDT